MKEIKFNNWRKSAFIFSTILVIGSFISIAFKGFNFSIDFTGGVLIELSQSGEEVSTQNIRETIKDLKINDFSVQRTEDGLILIKIGKKNEENYLVLSNLLQQTLNSKFLKTDIELIKIDFVSPSIGKELALKVIISVLISLVAILLYIGIRFQLRYSIGGVAALTHDIFITMGFISLFQIPFDLTIIAAILTVLGYSINDSVVIFDRLRESFQMIKNKTNAEIIQIALNKTLSRTLITAFTTLIAILAIILIGGSILKPFALVIFFGISIGTFSSIFISPIFLYKKTN
jgi:preprotein translocase subunit SecF